MAKKKPARKTAKVTFEVRFVGPELSPERIPLRAVSDTLSAVQDLASGRDPFETSTVPREKGIGLVDVKYGSAIYQCVSRAPVEAIENLEQVARLMTASELDTFDDEDNGRILVSSLSPIRSLSEVATKLNCRLDVQINRKRLLFSVRGDDYERISSHVLISGETTVVGEVQRVGGATKNRCLLSVPGRRRGLYCDVATRELARRLGQHIYEDIVAYGTAVWLHRTWRIFSFTINRFKQPRVSDAIKAIDEFRNAGLDAWDEIDDPEQYLREVTA